MATRPSESTEWPVIEQEQDERQRHEHGFGHQTKGKEKDHCHIAPRRLRLTDVPDVCRDSQHEKHATEHVLAFRDPCNGFDSQRMDGKDRRDECAPPQGGSHPPHHEEQEDDRRAMEQHVSQMMSAGFQLKKLAGRHVRNCRQRIPMANLAVSECVNEPIEGKSLGDVWVLKDRVVVIEIDEIKPKGGTEDQPDKGREKHANSAHRPFRPARGGHRKICTIGFVWHRDIGFGICGPNDNPQPLLNQSSGEGYASPVAYS